MGVIKLNSNKQESTYVTDDTGNTVALATVFADKAGNVTVDIDTMGAGCSLIICQDGNVIVDQTI